MIWLFFILWFIIAGWYTKRKFDSDAEIETWYDKLLVVPFCGLIYAVCMIIHKFFFRIFED